MSGDPIESDEFIPMEKEELYNSLISLGLNSVNSSYSYRQEFQALVESFLSLPISEIRGKWKYLDQGLKSKIVDRHDDVIFARIQEISNE